MLRAHGGRDKYHNEMLGYNSRLDELQAALLRVRLPRLDAANADRQRVAHRYNEALASLSELCQVPRVPPGRDHIYHQYTVLLPDDRRDQVAAHMASRGVPTMVYYKCPLYRAPALIAQYAGMTLPNTERATRGVLSLPIWPWMPDHDIDRVVATLREALGLG